MSSSRGNYLRHTVIVLLRHTAIVVLRQKVIAVLRRTVVVLFYTSHSDCCQVFTDLLWQMRTMASRATPMSTPRTKPVTTATIKIHQTWKI